MSKTVAMTSGRPLRLLLGFALPLMFGNVFQQLYTVVDIAIIGRGVGMNALAALGTVDWLNWMLVGIAQGFAQGFAVRIAQKFGEGDLAAVRRVTGQSALLAAALAVVGVVLSQLSLPLCLRLLRVPAALQTMATQYTRILFAGFPAVVFFNYCSGVLRAVGDSKTPLKAMGVAAVTNIALDCVAVFVLEWGIAGAALATVFSQCLSGLLCAVRIAKTPELHFGRSELAFRPALSADLIRTGAPLAAKGIVVAAGGMFIQTVVNGFELSFIAGYTATNKLYGLLEIAALSYGYAVSTYVGQNYGARLYPRIRSGLRTARMLSLATAAAIAAVMILFGRPITMLFISTGDPLQAAAAGQTAYAYLCVMSVCLPVLYLLYLYQAALQGFGETMPSMISGLLELVMRVGVAVFAASKGVQYGVFVAEVSAWVAAAIFLAISWRITLRKSEALADVRQAAGPSL